MEKRRPLVEELFFVPLEEEAWRILGERKEEERKGCFKNWRSQEGEAGSKEPPRMDLDGRGRYR